MAKRKEYIFFSIIIGTLYISLMYLEFFSKNVTDTYKLKYGIIWILFLETTFSLFRKARQKVWQNWLWKLRFAVLIADFFFLFTSYNASGIGGYLVVQMIYSERIIFRQHKKHEPLFAIEFASLMFLTGMGMFFGEYLIYVFGAIYGGVLFYNLKTVWKTNLFFLALSLTFLALCDTSIFLNYIWSKEVIGNLIWFFYIPSQLFLANYE